MSFPTTNDDKLVAEIRENGVLSHIFLFGDRVREREEIGIVVRGGV